MSERYQYAVGVTSNGSMVRQVWHDGCGNFWPAVATALTAEAPDSAESAVNSSSAESADAPDELFDNQTIAEPNARQAGILATERIIDVHLPEFNE